MLKPTTLINTDSTRSILQAASRFFSGTMLSRISGLMRDICLAYAFGTQSAVAALLVAFRFAHLLRRVLGEGAMQTAFIPHFEELRKEDPQRAGLFFKDLTYTLTHFLIFAILVIIGGLGIALKWGNFDSGNQEIIWLTLLMMPSLLFICLFGVNASLMQCEKKFFASSVAPVAFNLFWILGIFVSSQFPQTKAMTILSFFVIGACVLQWLVTLPNVYKILKTLDVSYLWKHSVGYSKDVLHLSKSLALGVIGVAASQINNALDAIFARWANEEGPAILWYAIRLQQLPLALFGIAIASALLPSLSRAGKANDDVQFHRFLDFAMQRTLSFMVPMTAGLLLVGDSCIKLIYGHGDFTNTSVVATTFSLWGYTLGLIPMALVLILAPAFYAKGNYSTPAKASLVAMILNVLLNILFITSFGLGATSVAIATSISAWVNFFWLGISLRKDSRWVTKELMVNTSKIVLATLVASLALIAFQYVCWGNFSAWQILSQQTPHYTLSFIDQILRLSLSGVIFGSIFVGLALLLRLHQTAKAI